MDHITYKKLHENFTSNNSGTSLSENLMVVFPCLLGGPLATAVRALIGMTITHEKRHLLGVFLMEFVCLTLPAVLSFTILADHLLILNTFLVVGWWAVLYWKLVLMHKHPKSFLQSFQQTYLQVFLSSKFPCKRRSYITEFRSFTSMMTVLCILAVDFNIFPRRFAKTETFGTGIMDIGVGLYVLSSALVSSENRPGNLCHTSFYRLFKNSIPLILLGVGRYVITYTLGYQEHVTEYGTHWNFFLTLAFSKIICGVIKNFTILVNWDCLLFSWVLIVFYEILLIMGLRDWIFSDAPRLDLISANREGISSLLGYSTLYFSGLFFKRELDRRDMRTGYSNIFLGRYLFFWSCFLWALTLLCENTIGISRRLANIGYILWVLAFTTTFIVYFIFCECFVSLQTIILSSQKILRYPPLLCEAINFNGLLFFLMGNVLTGIINLSFRTLFMGPTQSLIVLAIYMFVNCGVITVLYHNNLAVKV